MSEFDAYVYGLKQQLWREQMEQQKYMNMSMPSTWMGINLITAEPNQTPKQESNLLLLLTEV